MLASLAALDATLRLFDPATRVESIRPKAYRPGDGQAGPEIETRDVLAVLRAGGDGRRQITYDQLAERLGELGVRDTTINIRNKVARGGFSAVFFVQCLKAMGAKTLRLDGGE